MCIRYNGVNIPGELTDNKVYEVVGQNKFCYIVKNDSGVEQFYSISSPSENGVWINE